MFIAYTYQDWLATPEGERIELLEKIISSYKTSEDFRIAELAQGYYTGGKTAVDGKFVLKPVAVSVSVDGKQKKRTQLKEVVGNRINTDFFRASIVERTHYSLANGVTIDNRPSEKALGAGCDHALSTAAQRAQIHGICWLYWNNDHVEVLPAYVDGLSGFVALVDERTSQPMLGIHFWQLDSERPLSVRLFELDGMTEYTRPKDAERLQLYAQKRAYRQTVVTDAAGSQVVAAANYPALPLVPVYANELHRSALTPAIKRKLDAYNTIVSDFADNLEQANEIYWVLNNFGGTTTEIAEMLETIHSLKAVANVSDGSSSSTVEAKSFDVPYAAREHAISLLVEALHDDAMVVNRREINGGSLTNVAIESAFVRMDLGADELEWEVFAAVQQLLRLAGNPTEDISFKRNKLYNTEELVRTIYLMREDIDQQTALMKNPMIGSDEVAEIMQRTAQEAAARREMESISAAVSNTLTDAEEDADAGA